MEHKRLIPVFRGQSYRFQCWICMRLLSKIESQLIFTKLTNIYTMMIAVISVLKKTFLCSQFNLINFTFTTHFPLFMALTLKSRHRPAQRLCLCKSATAVPNETLFKFLTAMRTHCCTRLFLRQVAVKGETDKTISLCERTSF